MRMSCGFDAPIRRAVLIPGLHGRAHLPSTAVSGLGAGPTSPRSSRRSPSGPGRSTPPGCSSTATTTSPGGSAPRATSRSTKFDLSQRLDSGQTDIPRLREGGVKAQFWSVYIPSEHPNPARTVTEQIDLVHRMVERYPDAFEMAYTADDVERIARGQDRLA